MSDVMPSLPKRVFYRMLIGGLSVIAFLARRPSPRIALVADNLRGLLFRREYHEFWSIVLGPKLDARRDRLEHGSRRPKIAKSYPSDDAPLIASIIIPCYNYGAYLSEAVQSALRQTLGDVEVIVVDDASTDPATQRVLDRLESEGRVRVLRHSTNSRLPQARNTGISTARGEYICCLDADDTIEPTYLEKAIAALESDRSLGFVYSHVRLFGDVDALWETRDFDIVAATEDNHVSVSAIFRRDDWELVGGYDVGMSSGYEDWEFWLRLASLGRRGKTIAEPLFNHRRHGVTMTHDAHAKRLELISRMRRLNPGVFRRGWSRTRLRFLRSFPAEGRIFDALTAAAKRSRLSETQKPGLLVLVPWLPRGGSEMLLLSVLSVLVEHYRIVILTTLDGDSSMAPEFKTITNEIFYLPRILPEAAWIEFLRQIVVSRGVTTVLSSNCLFLYEHVAQIKGLAEQLRLVDIVHNDLPDGHLRHAANAAPYIDLEIGISEKVATSLEILGVAKERIAMIPNGVDLTRFQPNPELREEARERIGISSGSFVVTFVGRLSAEKRPGAFLSILREVRRRETNVTGLLIGDGPLADELKGIVNSIGDGIVTLQHVPPKEMPAVFAATDALVVTSEIEGMPFVVLEAMASGVPILSTDVGAISTLVRTGVNGMLVNAAEPERLTDAVLKLVAEPALARNYGAAARKTILDAGLDRRSMLRRYQEVLVSAS